MDLDHRGFEGLRRIEVQGHRGARALRPENTIPGFEYAIGEGVDAIELDMGVTKDRVVVICHDPILDAPVCNGPRAQAILHELTLPEVREWDCGSVQNPWFPMQQTVPGTRMPTLDEVFALAPRGRFHFNIEAKIFAAYPTLTPPPGEFARLVLAEVRRHRLESRVQLQSFDFRILHEMRKLAPEIRLAALYTGPPKSFVAIAEGAGADVVSPEHHLITPEEVRAAHTAGFPLITWTANAPEDWERLAAAGVDGIITDDPARLIGWLRRFNRLRRDEAASAGMEL